MTPVGGQAVLEGVMMRTPRFWAVSVRRPDGRISNVVRTATSPAARNRLLRLPIVRGVFALGDSMAIGFRALSLSAQYAATDEDAADGEAADELPRSAIIGAFAIAIAFGVGLFKWTPGIMARLLGLEKGVWFVLVEGGIKIALLVAYLAALNLVPDLKRVFQYHAAEHMAINALEAGDDLTVENVRRHSRIHVRCGTAFLLWVMLVSIVVFLFVTPDGWIPLLVSRLALLPLIAGIAYEVIRFAGRFGTNPIVHAVLAPGLWLQRLTTRPPSDDQLEVSIDALRHVLPEERQGGGPPRVEVMA
jgi:uncharacterized protein YqhQ